MGRLARKEGGGLNQKVKVITVESAYSVFLFTQPSKDQVVKENPTKCKCVQRISKLKKLAGITH